MVIIYIRTQYIHIYIPTGETRCPKMGAAEEKWGCKCQDRGVSENGVYPQITVCHKVSHKPWSLGVDIPI